MLAIRICAVKRLVRASVLEGLDQQVLLLLLKFDGFEIEPTLAKISAGIFNQLDAHIDVDLV